MSSMAHLDLRAVRAEAGLTQTELADVIGVSVRTVQSCEQGWRNPSAAVEKAALLLLSAKRNGADCTQPMCWEAVGCREEERRACLVFQTRQGHLCWLLSGNLCQGAHLRSWDDKKAACTRCAFFRKLLPGGIPMRKSP